MTDIDAAGPLPGVPPRVRGHGVARSGVITRAQGVDAAHPLAWAALAAAAAWWWVVATHAAPRPHAHPGHGGPSHGGGVGYGALAAMTMAMMLPLALGGVRGVARTAASRHRAAAAFLAGYLAVWMLAMVLIDAAWRLASWRMGGDGAAVGVLLAAGMWEVAAAVHPSIRACARPAPPVARGWRADLAGAAFGASSGAWCVLSCWALMAACVAFAHDLRLMASLFVVQLVGRYRPIRIRLHPRHPRAAGPVR